jgi:mannose-6-phosphate isomerase-like protein (cupin superfamily)
MPDFTMLVTDREELPPETFEWGTIQWLLNARLSPGAEQTLGICHILPGKANPLHYHPNCEELLYLLEGTGWHSLDDGGIDLRPGMTIRVPAGVKHHLVNTGTGPLTCLVVFSSGQRETVFVEA